jgi:hypothetical protein
MEVRSCDHRLKPPPTTGRFYVPSSGRGQRLKLAKQLSGDIALQAPLDVADGLALGEATLDVAFGPTRWCGARG